MGIRTMFTDLVEGAKTVLPGHSLIFKSVYLFSLFESREWAAFIPHRTLSPEPSA